MCRSGLIIRSLLLAMLLAAVSASQVFGQDQEKWPRAAASPELRESIEKGGYSASERRNIDTLIAAVSEPDGLATRRSRYWCAHPTISEPKPYRTLNARFGASGSFSEKALRDVDRQVIRVLAKGDQVYAQIHITGVHTGRIYGVQGTGKTLHLYERNFYTFGEQGRICESLSFPQQGELYMQLGGKFLFPRAASSWRCGNCGSGTPGMIDGFTPWRTHESRPVPSKEGELGSNGPRDFIWPNNTSEARVPVRVRRQLLAADMTAEEHRSVQTTIDRQAGLYRAPAATTASAAATAFGPALRPEERTIFTAPQQYGGFYILHREFGEPERNGWSVPSIEQVKTLERIIAKGGNVVFVKHIQGAVVGPFFGFAGEDQWMDVYEIGGTGPGFSPWSGDDPTLFQQLGGMLSLPER